MDRASLAISCVGRRLILGERTEEGSKLPRRVARQSRSGSTRMVKSRRSGPATRSAQPDDDVDDASGSGVGERRLPGEGGLPHPRRLSRPAIVDHRDESGRPWASREGRGIKVRTVGPRACPLRRPLSRLQQRGIRSGPNNSPAYRRKSIARTRPSSNETRAVCACHFEPGYSADSVGRLATSAPATSAKPHVARRETRP